MNGAKSYPMARQTKVRSDVFGGRLEGIRKRLADLNGKEQLAAPVLRELALAIEELQVAEEKLRQQNQQLIAAQLDIELERQRYHELFDLAPDAYLVTDVAGVVREANQSAAQLLRIEPRSLIGKALTGFVALEDRSRFRRELAALSPNRWAQRLTLRLEPREAAQIYASVMVSIARNPDGKPAGLRWLVRDVTAQRRMESEIRSINEELERRVAEGTEDLTAARRAAEASEAQSRHVQKLESIGVLAGGIAHDFNNLLHVVLGNADIATQRLPPDSPAREPLRDAIQATLHAADLTRQMLAYSGKGTFVIRDLDLSREVREMGTLLRTAISKQAAIVWKLARDLPAISADPTQVRQVVMNLITNASDALGEEGGAITLRTALVDGASVGGSEPPAEGPFVMLEVSDTGCGMSSDTLQRIFDPFFSTKFAGRGLGLAAVLGIVESHQGLIRIRTAPGEGTSFRVFLPAATSGAAPQQAETAGLTGWRGQGTVLVAEDDEGVRLVAASMLEELGFSVLAAKDGREAAQLIEQNGAAIRAVLLDLLMPRMGGLEVYRRLRAEWPQTPVVLMSGYTEEAVADQLGSSRQAATGFLQKPFLAEELAAVLRPLLEAAPGPAQGATRMT